MEEEEVEANKGRKISASAAYEMVASAASYLHSRTNNILPFTSSSKNENSSSEVPSCLTDSVTSVVAAEENVKQAVADDLKSTISSPCDWFICDDDQTQTRFVVIQVSKQKSQNSVFLDKLCFYSVSFGQTLFFFSRFHSLNVMNFACRDLNP